MEQTLSSLKTKAPDAGAAATSAANAPLGALSEADRARLARPFNLPTPRGAALWVLVAVLLVGTGILA